jgi:hypothetical protein
MINGDFRGARRHFTHYLELNQIRVDSDLDLANLIGLGLACEALEDYRFAQGYFQLAANFCLQRWYMITPSQCCTFFTGQAYGFHRLEPFEGLMRLAVRENDLSGGFYWSEKIHLLKIIERITCPDQLAQSDAPTGIGGENVGIRKSFVSVYSQMQRALKKNDRKLFSEFTSKLNQLFRKYPYYCSELSVEPIEASKISLKPNEALIEYQVAGNETFAWIVQNPHIIKSIRIPLSRRDLEAKIKKYLGSAPNRPSSSRETGYDPYLGQELYSLLLKKLLSSSPKLKELIIIPDGVLWNLPFETLISQTSGNEATSDPRNKQPLRNFLDIEYYQSATALQSWRQTEK